MEQKKLGQLVTLENRRESYEKVDKKQRQMQIIEVLNEIKSGTASEISLKLYEKGYTPRVERNTSAPRLTELCIIGKVEPIGKTKDKKTNRNVTVYGLKMSQEDISKEMYINSLEQQVKSLQEEIKYLKGVLGW